MKTLILLFVLVAFGCTQRPVRPNHYPALDYPFADISDLHDGVSLIYEGKDIGLDGGSHVYIFSTPEKRKIQLWDLCIVAKKGKGLEPNLNAFMLVFGTKNEDAVIVPVGSELESLLISITPKEIAAGISDRAHAIHY
ncbi:hypothetical protein [Rariglobus hedericola]|uniref:Uncharacterized protein n=1 Tax=Rariglobus hedericola TaxID=2597822 RepID=A0A556QEU8_9BACT|nr:hypothetical protein [Rariglobus hedericola]TSJ75136.1 hypothetical protein FPL22_17210 [Rariglobus hedericola]